MKACSTLGISSKIFACLILFLFTISLNAGTPRTMLPSDCAVPVIATSQKSPPAITLNWKKNDITFGYQIFRKMKDETSWSAAIATLDSSVTSWTDTNVQLGNAYEYMVTAIDSAIVTFDLGYGPSTYPTKAFGYGYIYAGNELAPVANQGRLILLVDETIRTALATEIDVLISDLVSEGWTVVERDVQRAQNFDSAGVRNVKKIIMDEYNKDTKNTNTVFILGRVPVPYSGDINKNVFQNGVFVGVTNATDAHQNHCGAWPADVYYGSLTESDWTDYGVNDILGSRQENWNRIGDGKFDLTQLVNDAKLAVARVDFYNMPSFKKGEIELLRSYLNHDHDYRTGQLSLVFRGLVDDNFGTYGEFFGQNGWRNFPPLVGYDSVFSRDWLTELSQSNYLWAYGCGGGYYNSCSGIGTTDSLVKYPMNVIFTEMFGSYFGDWDSQDNILRAILCSDTPALTACWAGRPSWYFHHMGSGVPIGFSHLISQNNFSISQNSLPLYMPHNFIINQDQYKGLGYSYSPIAGPGYVHMELLGDPTLTMYMGTVAQPYGLSVTQPKGQKVNIQWSKPLGPSVDGYNVYSSLSQFGPFNKINNDLVTDVQFTDSTLHEGTVYYMVRAVKLQQTFSGSFYNQSQGIIKNAIITKVNDNLVKEFNLSATPNPATDHVNISLSLDNASNVLIEVFDVNGMKIKHIAGLSLEPGLHQFVWNITNMNNARVNAGVYFIKVTTGEKAAYEKIVVMP